MPAKIPNNQPTLFFNKLQQKLCESPVGKAIIKQPLAPWDFSNDEICPPVQYLAPMEEGFELPVVYKGEEISFPGRLLNYGYSYKIELEIFGAMLLFEPDEQRNFRALIAPEEMNKHKEITLDLLEAIVSSLDELLK